jgi:4-azaleucine resistance transporter AzlC
MTTTITKPGKRNPRGGTARSPKGGHLARDRIRPKGVARGPEGALLEGPESASSAVTAFVSGARAIVPVLLALIPFAIAFGTSAKGIGLSAIEALGMSVFVFAGAAQLAAVQLISTGASAAIVVLTVLVTNLRLTLYSASLVPHFRPLPVGWKALLAYLLTDQAYAATITRFDGGKTREPDKRWFFLGVALAIWVTFQVATVLGVFLGAFVSEGWSLDFVLPLIFIALAVPAIKDRLTGTAAISAGAASVFCAALPLNLGLIAAALVGVLGGLVAERLAERSGR